MLDSILPHLYDLSQITPQNTGHCVADILKEKQQDFRAHCNSFPGLDTVCLRMTDHVHTKIYMHISCEIFFFLHRNLQVEFRILYFWSFMEQSHLGDRRVEIFYATYCNLSQEQPHFCHISTCSHLGIHHTEKIV